MNGELCVITDKLYAADELERENQTQIELSHNPSLLPAHTLYLNEEVDHVCVIALHCVHERTLATFDVLIRRKKAPWEKSVDVETVNVKYVML